MHLARPKSSKGRSRPPVSSSMFADDVDYSTQRPPVTPDPPVHLSRSDRSIRSKSQPHMSQDEVLQMLQQAPAAPPQSLNKYKVLPSIERRQGDTKGLDTHLSELHLSDGATHSPNPPPEKTCSPDTDTLLLAVRAPCGRRFQRHFDPTDTFLKVKSTAELEYGVQYGDVSIETMDVPRRTFTDMRMTLAQCGIINRSVLCISQK